MKEIHLIFQLLNFLASPDSNKYNLHPIDKVLLLMLAKHDGGNGIFPSQETISKETKISIRYVRERLTYLKSIDLILIKKVKRNHHYIIQIPELQFPHSPVDNLSIPEPQFLSYRNHSSGHSGTTVPTNSRENSKVIERAKTSLSDHFVFSEKNKQYCRDKNLDPTHVFTKFVSYMKSHGKKREDWEEEARLWIEREKKDKPSTTINEPRSIVPEYKPSDDSQKPLAVWKPGNPGWEAMQEIKQKIKH